MSISERKIKEFAEEPENIVMMGLAFKSLKFSLEKYLEDIMEHKLKSNKEDNCDGIGDESTRKLIELAVEAFDTNDKEKEEMKTDLEFLTFLYESCGNAHKKFGIILLEGYSERVETDNPLEAEFLQQQIKDMNL